MVRHSQIAWYNMYKVPVVLQNLDFILDFKIWAKGSRTIEKKTFRLAYLVLKRMYEKIVEYKKFHKFVRIFLYTCKKFALCSKVFESTEIV